MAKKEFLGSTDTLFLITLIHTELQKYVKAVDGKGLSTEDFTTALKTKLEGIDLTQYSTTTEMNSAIADAIKDVSGISFDGPYDSYEALVQTVTQPKKGTIYLVKNSGSAPNVSDEYFWNGTAFELFGTTSVDLTGYLKENDIAEIATTEIQTIWDSIFTA